MTSSKRRTVLGLLPVAAMLCFVSTASAQRSAQDIASARQLYSDGVDLRDKGDLKGALEKFKAAHALGNTPITGLDLCKTHQTLKQPVEAREACLSVARIGPIAEESTRSKDARVEAAKLAEVEKPKMGSLKVKIVGAPPGAQASVTIDGVALPSAALAAPRPVDPGPHVILASVNGGPQTKASLETKEGENRVVEIPVQVPAEGDNMPPPVNGGPAPARQEKKSSFPTVMYGIGGAGVALGAIGGIVAISKEGDLSDKCADKKCGRADWDTLDSARTWGTVSTVAFVVGGIALGIGLIASLAAPSRSGSITKPKSKLGFSFRGLDGTF